MFTVEKDWITKEGYRAVAISVENTIPSHRCGYVAIPKEHRLYGVNYNEQADCITREMVDKTTLGDKSPILILTACCRSDGDDLIRRSPDIFIECHGGLTYSSKADGYPVKTEEDVYWYGFDCAHDVDINNPKSLEFVIEQCENIAKQLKTLTN